uniref:hypothetical protein n=1 Tax=Yoonia sp. TaxID=2212373 RepID=UPI0040484BB2|tara:strand:- start:281 stop:517 length:237 start_codon:yes stop_codon:yes gene_type:complete
MGVFLCGVPRSYTECGAPGSFGRDSGFDRCDIALGGNPASCGEKPPKTGDPRKRRGSADGRGENGQVRAVFMRAWGGP